MHRKDRLIPFWFKQRLVIGLVMIAIAAAAREITRDGGGVVTPGLPSRRLLLRR